MAGAWAALILPPDAPYALRDALIGLASENYSCASAPIQVAALAAYELSPEVHAFLTAQRRILAAIGRAVYLELRETGLRVHPPQGGFYLLLDFSPFKRALARRGISTDEQVCENLLEERGVALLPGKAFGLPTEAMTARMAYVDFDGASALNARGRYRVLCGNPRCEDARGHCGYERVAALAEEQQVYAKYK